MFIRLSNRAVRIVALCAAMLFACLISARADGPQGGLAQLVGAAKPAVVFIVVATNSGAQSGSGFVYQSDATTSTIITANHVVEGGTQVDVIFDSDEHERYQAQVVKRDHKRDVAILKVAVGHRPTLLLDSSRDIQEGTSIVVMGYPRTTLGFRRVAGDDLRPTVHSGIVSAIRLNGEIIQFDAVTDHGDSGGPIIDVSTGRVLAIVHGAELDASYASRGLEQQLPGSSFGPSAATIATVFNGAMSIPSAVASTNFVSSANANAAAPPSTDTMSAGTGAAPSAPHQGEADSASYRVGYGVPDMVVTEGSTDAGSAIIESVNSSVLSRLQTYLQADNSLYLIQLKLPSTAISDTQHLMGYCDDNRLNAIAVPVVYWHLTGGERHNAYGASLGYSGTASVKAYFVVFDCFGIPFFAEEKEKSENRYFAHRGPQTEIVDMANDLLDQLTTDFSDAKAQKAAVWKNLLKTGISIDPADQKYHSLVFFAKKPEGYQVTTVVPNGPADTAGVKIKDVIVKINGTDATNMSLADLLQQMNAPEYTLEVQRPSGIETITVHPVQYDQIVKLLQH